MQGGRKREVGSSMHKGTEAECGDAVYCLRRRSKCITSRQRRALMSDIADLDREGGCFVHLRSDARVARESSGEHTEGAVETEPDVSVSIQLPLKGLLRERRKYSLRGKIDGFGGARIFDESPSVVKLAHEARPGTCAQTNASHALLQSGTAIACILGTLLHRSANMGGMHGQQKGRSDDVCRMHLSWPRWPCRAAMCPRF